MDRLVQLFKDADEKTSWVRVPIINYLRACPKPEAKKHIEELKKIDPDAVKRASTFFPFGGGMGSPSGNESSATDRMAREALAKATWEGEPARLGEVAFVPSSPLSEGRPAGDPNRLPSNPFHVVGVLWLVDALSD